MKPESRLSKWATIVEELELDLSAPVNTVTAQDIKAWASEEPRLMAKIDRREELPPIFRENGVFLLPVANGEYVIVQGDGYHDLENPPSSPSAFASRVPFELISAKTGASESQYIDFATNSGLIEQFASVGQLFLSIRGRKRAPEFEFRVGNIPLKASGVQVEIDAGFEGEHDIVVLEGKVGAPRNFHVRQLYYPYRFWKTIAPDKNVIPVFFTFRPNKRLTTFWEYRFVDPNDFTSIELVRARSYTIHTSIQPPDQVSMFPISNEPLDLVPQANDFAKVGQLPFKVAGGAITSQAIAEAFGFQLRQANYYREAAEALGLVMRRDHRTYLTSDGRDFISRTPDEQTTMLQERMLRLPLFADIVQRLLIRRVVTDADIRALIVARTPVRGETVGRRASTVMSWLRWLQHSTGLVDVRPDQVRWVGGALL